MLISVDNPPINSLINTFALVKAYKQPIYNNLFNKRLFVSEIPKPINKIIDIKICNINNENKILNHDLKKKDVLGVHNDKKEKGVNNKNTFKTM